MQVDTISSWLGQTEVHYFVVAGVFALILKRACWWVGVRSWPEDSLCFDYCNNFSAFDALPIREHPQRQAALWKLLLPSHCVAEEACVLSVGEAPSGTANKLKGVCSLTAVLFANLSCCWAELFGSSSQSRRCDAVSPGRLARGAAFKKCCLQAVDRKDLFFVKKCCLC